MAEQVRNRYELLETLGRGGEGRVVKALDRQHERVVALKIRTVRDDVDRDELLAEARLLLEVPSHPSLPLVREDFFENGEYLIAMDFVDGIDLARLLASRGDPGLAPSSVLAYLADAADALTHLHTQHPSVIHGDVKPGNLILTRGGRVKLVDFGMSSTPVPRRRRVGTPGFRAPELAADYPASRASDIYSLAATAFALLTGSAPDGRLPTWEGFDPDEAAQLEAVLREGLSNDPARRPQTAGEFVERLRAGWASSLPTGVMTFCLSDIEGSTPMWEAQPELMATALVRHDELIADVVEARGGRFLKSMGEGDSTVSVFPAAVGAVEAAIEITHAIAGERWPDGIEMSVRIGLHTGEAERHGTDYIGPTLNTAARLRGQADGGQVFCSETTADLVTGHLPDGHDLVDLGPHHLKGIRSAQRVFAISGPGLDTPFPSTSCPYRGLLSFESDDRDLFFGREDVVASVLGRIAPGRLLALVGASGSGKSSVLRAGLVAAARAGDVPGCGVALVTTPGSTPVLPAHESDVLIVVDQFEELFTLCTDAAVRTAYIETLVAHPGCVVIGVRADFYGQLGSHAALARAVADNQILLGAMTEDDLRRAITEPARLAGLKLEPGLVDVIVRDIAGEPGALPLLSHALRATWERRDGRTMTLDGYRETGGVESAIARSADTIFDETSEDNRPLLRGLLLRLTEIGDGVEETRRRVDIPDLVPAGASRVEVDSVLDRLADARLVTLDEGTAEVAHEALIREWPRLRSWLDEDREGLQLHRRLGDAARIWDATGCEPSDLYRGARLAAVEEWAGDHTDDLNATERAFLDASEREDQAEAGRQRRANRRLRRLLAGTAIALVVALVAGLVAMSQRNHADAARSASDEQRDRARIARLVAESERELDSHLDLAFLLAAEAWRRQDTSATRGALLTALTHNVTSERERLGAAPDHGGEIHHTHSSFAGFLAGPPRLQSAVDVSADGRIVASAGTAKIDGSDGLVLVFDTDTRREIGRINGDDNFHAVDVSADGRTVLAASRRSLILFDTLTGTADRLNLSPAPDEQFVSAVLRPGHTELLVTTTDGEITLWDWAAHEEVDADLPPSPVSLAQFRPDGALVVDQPGFKIVFWDLDRGAAERSISLQDPGIADWAMFTISADGRRMAGAQAQGRVFLWDLATGRLVGEPSVRPGTVAALAFDPRNSYLLATGRIGGGIEFDDVRNERVIGTPRRGHGGVLRSLVYSEDARYLVSTADDGLIGLWTDNGARGLMSRPLAADASNPVLSPDGHTMLVRNATSDFVVWNDADPSKTGATLRVPSGGAGASVFGLPLALDADGRRALVRPDNDNPQLHVADTRTGADLWTDSDRGLNVHMAGLSPDGQTVAAIDEDQVKLVLVDVDSGERRATATVPDGGDWFAGPPRFSADGAHVDVALRRGIARYAADGLRREQVVKAGFDVHTSVAEVPGTDDVIAGGGNGVLARWNLETGRLVATGRSSDPSGLLDLAVSHDGRSVVAYHLFTYELALFDATTLQSVGRPFPVGDQLFSPRFSADGRYVYGNGLLGGVARWDVEPHRWLQSACLAAGRNLTRAEWDEYLGRDEPYRPTCDRWAH